jgi:catechol 2,3-dioxygenase-like lactoylglutathione lyase family enzyme
MPLLEPEKFIAFVATSNPERAKGFYRDTLGLPLVREDDFAITFDVAGTMLRVTPVPNVVLAPYTVLGWQVANIVETARRLQKTGISFERYEWMQQDELGVWQAPGGARVAWFKDPDGNLLSITQF